MDVTAPKRMPERAETGHFMYASRQSDSIADDAISESSAASNLSYRLGKALDSTEEAQPVTETPANPPRPLMMSDNSPDEVFHSSDPSSTPAVSEAGPAQPESVVSSVVSVDLRMSSDPTMVPMPIFVEETEVENEILDSKTLQDFRLNPNPIEDAERIIAALPVPSDDPHLKKLTRPDRMRQVLVLGATGHIGQQIVRFLAQRTFEGIPTFHCLIRANSLEAAQARLLSALESVTKYPAEAAAAMAKCRVWLGDITEAHFGLEESDYQKLCGRVEGIYMAVGPDWTELNKLYDPKGEESGCSYYGMACGSAVRVWSGIFDFAATIRMKHIYAFVPLFYSVELFVETAATSNSVATVLESQVFDRFSLNKLSISPHSNFFGCIAWCKGVVETVLKYARKALDYSVTIFRVPPFGFWSSTELPNKVELKRKPCFTWLLLRSMVREGKLPSLPDHVFGLFAQPLDEALKAAVSLSLAPRRVHWIYHMVDDHQLASFTKQSWSSVINELGIYLENCSVDDWIAAVAERGPGSCLAPYIAAIQNLMHNTSLNSARTVQFSNTHLKQDLSLIGQIPQWTSFGDFGKNHIRHLLHSHFFPPDSRGTLSTFEDCRKEAIKISGGLENFGPHIDTFLEGWKIFLKSIQEPSNPQPTFWGRASITRTIIVYMTTHLYMTERERVCPKILDEEIKAPLFVVGLNRAGTTFVHSMLGQDTANHRCPVLLEMLFPYGEFGNYQPVGLEVNDMATWEQDPRRAAATELITLQMGSELKKHMEALHSRIAVSYEEDLVAFELVGRSYSMAAGFQADSFMNWLFENDAAQIRNAYPFHKRLFQHLQYQRPGKRWIFKMPWHLWTIETLFETYPDAELVFVHRRPSSAIQSWCGLEKLLHSNFLVRADLKKIGERGLLTMSLLIDKALQYQESLAMKFVQEHPDLQPPQSFFYNLYFDQMVESPIVCIREIYERIGLGPLTLTAESAMWAFMEEAQKHRASVAKMYPHCDLGDVGLTKRDIKTQFAAYYAMYFDPTQRERRLQEFKTAKAIRRNEVQREKHYDENGSLVIEGPSILERAGFDYARRNMETMFSYAKTKLFTPLQSDV
eukprot:Gregarina_sp_Pseudo_9__3854@NODE_3_length_7435_cov_15_869389_g2_i0_p1_GENE_NODE_3_length_7435_cov_15_869389_g2_i0NODE_3_length_7435_cov_15_869389_g2_i0_p1_ORF_typecomplete_len1091_score146_88Sulfotransfer_3/PF13469_6/3_7e24NAD_binding_4/PF07993_12/1_9e15Sulfotransfer_1/PF00685_27/0_00059NmrA/PF05368_13/0_0071Sulfotransfer_4/PF17784_1/3_4e02Sulfotransfer_4/PF17784_1/0_31Sacchrp_dh_NADP/PF03435_18/0_089Sacchrp_dh_NADP/PF03435_18/1_8e04Semialdhyde_dh/PF01118_24/0_094Epimerase/PF01370_21/0_12RmlD_su